MITSIIFGSIAYLSINSIFDIFMKLILDCEVLGCFDAIFLLDGEKNYSNIVICIVFESFKYDEMKSYLIEKTKDLHRGRSKLVKYFG